MSLWYKISSEFNKGNSAIRQIIFINLVVFIFIILVGVMARLGGFHAEELLQYFYLKSNLAYVLIRPWSIITNLFFHVGFMHLAGNMLLLFFIGRILEEFMSHRRVWTIFILGGIAGCLFFVLAYNVFPVFQEQVSTGLLLGASGGVTAILVATAVYLPRYIVRPFGLFDVEMRWVALFFVFRDLYTFPVSDNVGGLLAHIGGALFGLLYIWHIQGKLEFSLAAINPLKIKPLRKTKPDETHIYQNKNNAKTKPNQAEIDAILDKISQSGYDSLSKSEKETLFKASE